jgi:hypothetical protein
MNESLPQEEVIPNPDPKELAARKNIESWERFPADKDLDGFTDQEILKAFLAWNRYRAGKMFFRKTLVASHDVQPREVVPWIKKLVDGEAIPDELQFLSADAPHEVRQASEAALDARAFFDEYSDKRKERTEAAA